MILHKIEHSFYVNLPELTSLFKQLNFSVGACQASVTQSDFPCNFCRNGTVRQLVGRLQCLLNNLSRNSVGLAATPQGRIRLYSLQQFWLSAGKKLKEGGKDNRPLFFKQLASDSIVLSFVFSLRRATWFYVAKWFRDGHSPLPAPPPPCSRKPELWHIF